MTQNQVVVIGAGPAGLMAAEALAGAGVAVQLMDAMPSAGRKFLLAGKGGLNLTHSEPTTEFVARYGSRAELLAPLLAELGGAQGLRDWAQGLGISTFIGTSGRVFPTDMKAAPLLRAWLQRLRGQGVQLQMRHRWLGWAEDAGCGPQQQLRFATPKGEEVVPAAALVLALGGASWPQLGSDGAWQPWLAQRGVPLQPLQPANCGFDLALAPAVRLHRADASLLQSRHDFLRERLGAGTALQLGWSSHFTERFAGQPFKSVQLSFTASTGERFSRRGEFVATEGGVEGSLIYAVSALLRDEIAACGHATFTLDLLPAHSGERVLAELRHPRGSRSLPAHLKSRLGLDGIKLAALYEVLGKDGMQQPEWLAQAIKALPLTVLAPRPLAEAISTAGGVAFEALDAQLMLQALPGVFCAGEMLDWEAPTGGYLLTACLATGRRAGLGAASWLAVHGKG